MHTEQLKPSEQSSSPTPVSPSVGNILSEAQVKRVMQEREETLTELRPVISRKLLFKLEEKLKKEQQEFQDLLDAHLGRKQTLSKYSFVLDPQYFEQLLLSEP